MKTPINTSPQISYLLSFLGILVDRAGGELVIENLSSYGNHNLQLGMKLDTGHDRVTLRLSGGITKRAADLSERERLPLNQIIPTEGGAFFVHFTCQRCLPDNYDDSDTCHQCGKPRTVKLESR